MTAQTSFGPTLLVLAAGMGSRYGGLKQLESVGPGGGTLMDYALFDAARAGFARAVFVIRPDMSESFGQAASSRYGARLGVATVEQHVPAGRSRPWGTAEAVLVAKDVIDGPFAVVNADDFYGRAAYDHTGDFLRDQTDRAPWAVAGYRLAGTVSAAGGVNRALCRVQGEWLESIEEITGITPSANGFEGRSPGGPVTLTGNEMVSMNMWAFTTNVFDVFAMGFERFAQGPLRDGEFLLPAAVDDALRVGDARVRVLDPGATWFGITHREDREHVVRALAELTRRGEYPERLW